MCSSRRSFGTGSENGCLALGGQSILGQIIPSLYRDRLTILLGYDFFNFHSLITCLLEGGNSDT